MIPKVPRRVPEDPPMLFVGNLGWVDFVNTRYAGRTGPVEALTGPAAVARWLKAAGMGTEPDGAGAVTRDPRLLAEAFRLRAALLETAVALSSGRPVPDPALEAINRVLRAGAATMELSRTATGFVRRRRTSGRGPVALLTPVAESAAEFLCEGDPARLHRCANPSCVLYFYDTTRNRHRRFCSPATCGNLMKARERYRRLKEARRPGAPSAPRAADGETTGGEGQDRRETD